MKKLPCRCAIPVLLVVLAGVYCTKPVERTGNPREYGSTVTNFTVVRNVSDGNFRVTWGVPDPLPDFYILSKKRPGATMADEVRISGDSVGYTDIADILNGSYEYFITPYKVNQATADTFQGVPSEVVILQIGATVTFKINNGISTTKTRSVFLTISDLAHSDPLLHVVSVRFTQMGQTVLERDSATGTGIVLTRRSFNYNDLDNVIPNAELATLTADGYLTSGGTGSGVLKTAVPNFDSIDANNTAVTINLVGKDTTIPWQLLPGNGVKRVFAEVQYADGSRAKDTLKSDISIAPHRISVRLTNTVELSNAEMVVGGTQDVTRPNEVSQYINKPRIRFSVSIDGDSTFSDTFTYWLAVKRDIGKLDFDNNTTPLGSPTDSQDAWIETQPETGVLTAPGVLHDENFEYVYDFDTNTVKGREHLSSLQMTIKGLYESQNERKYPFRLSGLEHFNEFAVPGRYWGAKPYRFIPKSNQVFQCDSVITGTPGENFRRLLYLSRSNLTSPGWKECVLILRFKGKHFGDVRVAWSGSNGYAGLKSDDNVMTFKINRIFLDLLPPVISPCFSSDPEYLTNGDTVSSAFNFKLAYSLTDTSTTSVVDKGWGRVTSVELIIAEKPTSVSWSYWTFSDNFVPSVSLESLLAERHVLIPFPVTFPRITINNVIWRDIDPTQWRSGQYFIGVITSDEWGNKGLAVTDFGSEKNTNPFLINVVSGR